MFYSAFPSANTLTFVA